MKPQIIGTGLAGMVGSRLVELLSPHWQFEDLSLEKGFDITNFSQLKRRFDQTKAEICLHLAAVTNVDQCEEERDLGGKSLSWRVNVQAAGEIAKLTRVRGIYLIYISTEFVFDGTKLIGQTYNEDDQPHPINWYGETKYRGELAVKEKAEKFLIVRIASPYQRAYPHKKDFARAIQDQLAKGVVVKAVADSRFSPTLVDDLALALATIFQTRPRGLLHLVGANPLSPFEAALKIAQTYQLNSELVKPVSNQEYFLGRAQRGLNLALSNEKAAGMGITMRSFEEGLKVIGGS